MGICDLIALPLPRVSVLPSPSVLPTQRCSCTPYLWQSQLLDPHQVVPYPCSYHSLPCLCRHYLRSPSQGRDRDEGCFLWLPNQLASWESSLCPTSSLAQPWLALWWLWVHTAVVTSAARRKIMKGKRKKEGSEPERALQAFCILRKHPEVTPRETASLAQQLQCFLQKLP